MRKLILAVVLVLLAVPSIAGVSYEILKTDLDENGNIRVYTQYKQDGVEVVSKYPKLDGKYYWVTRYNVVNFDGKTETEIKALIEADLKQFGEAVIRNTYIAVENQKAIDTTIKNFVGVKGEVTSTKIQISETKEWIIEDGQKTDSLIAVDPIAVK